MKRIPTLLAFTMLIISCTPKKQERQATAFTDLNSYKAVTATNDSKHVSFTSIEVGDCQWTDGFWADQWKHAEQTMIPYMGTLLKGDTGHGYNNFKLPRA